MMHPPSIPVLAALGILIVLAGCTSPAAPPVSSMVPPTTSPEVPPPPTIVEESPSGVSPADTSVLSASGPVASSEREIYLATLAIPMDREKYKIINFEDLGYSYLNPGEEYIVRFTSDHAIFAYVIRTQDVSRLNAEGGIPEYDPVTRTYGYGRLIPIMKIENQFEDGARFRVEDFSKYSLVLDTRLSQKDYRFANEITKVTVRILRVG